MPSANVWAALAKSNFICCTEILWNLKLLLKISTKYTPLRKFICMYHLYNIRERNKWLFPQNTYSKNVRSHLVQSLSFAGYVLIYSDKITCAVVYAASLYQDQTTLGRCSSNTHIIFHSVLGFFLNYLFCCKKFINSAVIFSDRYSTVLQASNVFFFIQYSIITLLQCRNRPILDKNHHLLHVLSTSLYIPWCVIQIEPMVDKIA